MSTTTESTRVLLNATRSEALDLLESEAPPRPGSLIDSVGEHDDAYTSKTVEFDHIDSRRYNEDEFERRKPEPRLWAPTSRAAASPRANGISSDAGLLESPSQPRAAEVLVTVAAAPATPDRIRPAVPSVVEGRVRPPTEAVTELREMDVRAASVGLPRIKPHWTHRYMKILLVGESGLGKTTFVRNLFAAYARDASFPVNDASTPNAWRIFAENPEALCTEIVLQDTDNKVYYHYSVQDTPGYGDSNDLATDRRAILDHIQDSSLAFLDQEQDPERRAAMHALRDTRVDVALYFIPPHRLRNIDLRFMAELAQLVPVVPLLAKADTMTSEELKEFRHKVRDTLRREGIRSPFSGDALEDAGARAGPPFSIIGSNTMDLGVGRFWPVRRYPWGSVEAMLTQHSDLPVLRRLLFETGYLELKDGTERRFHEFRHKAHPARRAKGFLGAVNGLTRRIIVGGGVVFVVWLLAGGGVDILKDEVRRKEVARRVKEKVGEAVEQVVEVAQEVGGKAQEAAAIAKTTGVVAADGAKRTAHHVAKRAGRALETEAARERREAELYKNKPWWKFWGE